MLPSIRPDAECPPLRFIVYAIRNILSPSLLRGQITDLLTLLAHVDCVRKKFLSSIDIALTWDAYYKHQDNNPGVLVLERDEVQYLRNISDRLGDRMRHIHRKLVTGFSLVVCPLFPPSYNCLCLVGRI